MHHEKYLQQVSQVRETFVAFNVAHLRRVTPIIFYRVHDGPSKARAGGLGWSPTLVHDNDGATLGDLSSVATRQETPALVGSEA